MTRIFQPTSDIFTFGADPEGFIFKGAEPVPAYGIIPGTKQSPHPVKQGAVQVDGMAAEFNINPAKTFEEFNDNVETVISELKSFLPSGYSLRFIPSVVFSEAAFDSTPDDNKELGCSADFNAWDNSVNPPPVPENPFMRCAGGHLHTGWTENQELDAQHISDCNDLIKQMDWFLGFWSLSQDADNNRRKLYGKSGACRYKPYGVEYRVLSNFWVSTKALRLQIWNRWVAAVNTMATIYMPESSRGDNNLLRNCIDQSHFDQELASLYSFPLLSLRGI